jgi:hypothetical protein
MQVAGGLDIKAPLRVLPICSYCKRVRSRDETWERLERCLADQINAPLSHGICPSCYATAVAQLEGSSV